MLSTPVMASPQEASADTEITTLGLPAVKNDGSFYYKDITVSGSDTYSSITVSIEGGTVAVTEGTNYTIGYDLTYTTALISFTDNAKSAAEAETFLKNNVTFTAGTESTPKVTIGIDSNTTTLPEGKIFSVGDGDKYGLSGHYYMYVPFSTAEGTDKSWSAAYNAAKTYYYRGMKGYLATINEDSMDGQEQPEYLHQHQQEKGKYI